MASSNKHAVTADNDWFAASWRNKPIKQAACYRNLDELLAVEKTLKASAALLPYSEIVEFKKHLQQVACGRALLLQAGDCAEVIRLPTEIQAYIASFHAFFQELSTTIEQKIGKKIISLGRIAGQLSKPRSSKLENGFDDLPSYRGDLINDIAYNSNARQVDAKRMLLGYSYSAAAIKYLQQLKNITRHSVYTSHEALLLPYEEALVRQVSASNIYYASSAHMLWIGERTRQYDHAHVEFCRGLLNPIGIKLSRHIDIAELLDLIERLNPFNETAKIILIARFGANYIDKYLPQVIKAVTKSAKNVIWLCDPMHGNNFTIENQKIRYMTDIKQETKSFFEICQELGVYAGGVHFEATYENVAECIDDSFVQSINDVRIGYKSYCDPRLNNLQARDYVRFLSQIIKEQ
ncbi:MAG: 3-deoxy-7-phosphoheptulonate synthase [Alphaproteobacteria bacterium]|nr:3-deoxy-7-phosphoheptulonate synthase [Alphaproteobacteria bacterium]